MYEAESIRPVHNPPTHNRRHHLPHKLPAIKRSVARQRTRRRGLKRPALLGIEDGYVGEVAFGQRTSSAKIEDARWSGCQEFDDARERNLMLAVELSNRQRQRRFEAGDAE